MNDKPRKKIAFTAEQRVQHRAIRDAFRDWHPGPEELIASGAAAQLGLNVLYAPARELLAGLKRERQAAGLSLAEVSRRCRIDQPALSRLENGHNPNPTLETLWKYAAALGKRLVLSTEDLGTAAAQGRPNDTPRPGPARRRRATKGQAPPVRKRRGRSA
jgi:transcriptional regulator with XRE-family HTH domain